MIDNYLNQDNKKQKIVLVAEFCDKKINSTGLYWHQIAESLSKNYQVIIVSPNVNPKLSNLGCEVRAFPRRFKFLKKLVPEKLYTTLVILFVLLKTPLKESKVLIGTNPLFLPLAVPLIKLLRPKEINLICYDLFPQNLILQSNFFLKVFLYFVSKFYLISYRMLDKIIVVGRDMACKVAELKLVNKSKIFYVPNWGENNNKKLTFRTYNNDSKLKILFFGNLGRFQNIPNILEQISFVSRKDVQFIFAGAGEYEKEVQQLSFEDKRVIFIGSIPMSQREDVYMSAHISIVSVMHGMKGLCVPSKAYFSLINAHPIISFVESESEVDFLCREYGCGWVIDPTDKKSLNSLLLNLTEDEYKSKLSNTFNMPKDLLNGNMSLKEIHRLVGENILK